LAGGLEEGVDIHSLTALDPLRDHGQGEYDDRGTLMTQRRITTVLVFNRDPG
jgi:hypothetical protein